MSDPNGPSGIYLSVRNSSGQIYQGIVSGIGGGNPRIYEDAKGRLWLIEFSDTTRILRLNDNFTLGAPTTLSFRIATRALAASPHHGEATPSGTPSTAATLAAITWSPTPFGCPTDRRTRRSFAIRSSS